MYAVTVTSRANDVEATFLLPILGNDDRQASFVALFAGHELHELPRISDCLPQPLQELV
jgi:hypothetical protein